MVFARRATNRAGRWWRRASFPPLLADTIALGTSVAVGGGAHPVGLAYAAVALVVLRTSAQTQTIVPRLAEDVGSLLRCLGAATLTTAPMGLLWWNPTAFLRSAVLSSVLVILGRAAAYEVVAIARAHGFVREEVLIAGAGGQGVRLARTLLLHPEFGMVPVGFLAGDGIHDLPLPLLGDLRDLPDVVRRQGVSRVIVDSDDVANRDLSWMLRNSEDLPIEIHVISMPFELRRPGAGVEEVWGIPLEQLSHPRYKQMAWRAKRWFDVVGALILLVAASPLLGLAALAVRLTSPGPILFRQKRIGQGGEVFELLKFRTLAMNDDGDTTWSVESDKRTTAVGELLRRTCVDELPQLINILRGEMSLVGPRPERPLFVERFRVDVPGYEDRLRVSAGLTGWAQIHGLRGNTSIEERAAFDNLYIDRWSFWRDIVIVARSFSAVLRGGPPRGRRPRLPIDPSPRSEPSGAP